jgi:hypothetical protein
VREVQELFDLAFARFDRAESKRREFSKAWGDYISVHPWDVDVREVEPRTFEILAVMREPAPIELSMIFSEWLTALRAALDNGLYAWVAAATGRNPPPKAERIQYPVCSTAEEFRDQRKRLSGVPEDILDKVERRNRTSPRTGPRVISRFGSTSWREQTGTGVLTSGWDGSTSIASDFECPRALPLPSTKPSSRTLTSRAS